MKYKQVLTPFREFRVTAAKTTFEVKIFHIIPISQLRSSFIQRLRKKKREEDSLFLDSAMASTNELEF
jgi:hypothetical protein